MLKRQANDNNGFTIIELLVVIAIISLLVSILLPSLNQAKALARQTVCLSNLRSIGTATSLYASEFGRLGPLVGNLDGDYDNKRVFGNYDLLEPYLDTHEIFVCPDLTPRQNSTKRQQLDSGWGFYKRVCHSGYMSVSNQWFSSADGMREPEAPWMHGELTDIARPGETINLFEGLGTAPGPYTSGNESYIGFLGDVPAYDGSLYWGIRYPHGQSDRMGVIWFDGHASSEEIFLEWRPFVGYP